VKFYKKGLKKKKGCNAANQEFAFEKENSTLGEADRQGWEDDEKGVNEVGGELLLAKTYQKKEKNQRCISLD